MSLTLRTIQERIGGQLSGHGDTAIAGVNALEIAKPGELTYADAITGKHVAQVRQSSASACIVPKRFPCVSGPALLRVAHPRLAFLQATHLFAPEAPVNRGVHRQAVVASDAEIGVDVTISECAVIRPRARIGQGTVIESGVHVGEGASIGASCFIGPNVVIMAGCQIGHRVRIHGGTVIGSDGFGYVWAEGRHLKIPQQGTVIIEDDVELGANVCVDCATFGSTIIKRGTKVDNLVQIAHNDVIGEHVILSGQVGLAGSVHLGDRVILAGQVGVVDHLSVGDDARVGAKSAVTKPIPSGQTYWGVPARPMDRVKRELAALSFVPNLLKQVRRSTRSRRRVRPRPSKR